MTVAAPPACSRLSAKGLWNQPPDITARVLIKLYGFIL